MTKKLIKEKFLSDFSINILVDYSRNQIAKFGLLGEDIIRHKELIDKRANKGITNNSLLEKVIKDTEDRKKKIIEELLILKKDLEKLGKTIIMSDKGFYLSDFKK